MTMTVFIRPYPLLLNSNLDDALSKILVTCVMKILDSPKHEFMLIEATEGMAWLFILERAVASQQDVNNEPAFLEKVAPGCWKQSSGLHQWQALQTLCQWKRDYQKQVDRDIKSSS